MLSLFIFIFFPIWRTPTTHTAATAMMITQYDLCSSVACASKLYCRRPHENPVERKTGARNTCIPLHIIYIHTAQAECMVHNIYIYRQHRFRIFIYFFVAAYAYEISFKNEQFSSRVDDNGLLVQCARVIFYIYTYIRMYNGFRFFFFSKIFSIIISYRLRII